MVCQNLLHHEFRHSVTLAPNTAYVVSESDGQGLEVDHYPGLFVFDLVCFVIHVSKVIVSWNIAKFRATFILLFFL
jgi:hypothetical protein